jgi:prepilin-type N-terminal cleavage/methylation domain-containing protein
MWRMKESVCRLSGHHPPQPLPSRERLRFAPGFSLVEVLITIAILGIVLTAITNTFVDMLKGFKQQGKIAETSIEGIIGLEILRRDIESAGYGLPWTLPAGASFSERADAYRDDSPLQPPRAILCGNADTATNSTISGADYLVIKAVNVARNVQCQRWAYLTSAGTTTWNPSSEDLGNTDMAIVISPGTPEKTPRSLVVNNGTFAALKSNLTASGFASSDETRIVYGIRDSGGVNRPFHRADYYVKVENANMPSRCAPGTGILYKNVHNLATDGLGGGLPLIDCVADMQVITRHTTTNGDEFVNGLEGTFAADAQTIRNQLTEVRVYILAHEGQKDSSFTYPSSTIRVGQSASLGRDLDLTGITDWQNYRWKVYTLVVKPRNLR